MVTNYPQQLAATSELPSTTTSDATVFATRHGASRPDVLRPSRPRLGPALRGQARDDALHVVRARHAGLGGQRTRSAQALRRRCAPPSAHDVSGSCCARQPDDRRDSGLGTQTRSRAPRTDVSTTPPPARPARPGTSAHPPRSRTPRCCEGLRRRGRTAPTEYPPPRAPRRRSRNSFPPATATSPDGPATDASIVGSG